MEKTYETRTDLMNAKKEELFRYVNESIVDNTCALEIMDSFFSCGYIKMTPPEEPTYLMHMLTVDSINNYESGYSIKPGNVILNMRKLIDSLPEITTSIIAVSLDIPILKVCAALNIWKMLRNLMTIEIKKAHAIVIAALWKNRNKENIITLDYGFECSLKLYKEYNNEEFKRMDYERVIEDLVKINSVEFINGDLWLCERVSKKYG